MVNQETDQRFVLPLLTRLAMRHVPLQGNSESCALRRKTSAEYYFPDRWEYQVEEVERLGRPWRHSRCQRNQQPQRSMSHAPIRQISSESQLIPSARIKRKKICGCDNIKKKNSYYAIIITIKRDQCFINMEETKNQSSIKRKPISIPI